jgi:hypothetical protein
MWWPFGRENREPTMVLASTVTLTDEEHRECEAFLKSVIPQSEDSACYMPAELADIFKRAMAATCMMGRAHRFATLHRFHEACEAASKACCIDPQCTHFYEFGRILESAGKAAEARKMFSEFLRRYEVD